MILVTGGTGFVGREVVAELLRLGHPVRLLVRHPEKAAIVPEPGRIELVRGDVLKPETLPAALAGVQVVIHLVGFILETAHISYEQGHFEATRNVLTAAKAAGVTRWIQMSAAGTRPHARSRYHQTKWRAEELVRASGLDWTIFRPSLIYGYDQRDRLLNLFRRILSPPLDLLTLYSIGLINGGEPKVQPVSVKEVARCFALAPQTSGAIGHTFDLVGPAPMRWREMIETINGHLPKKRSHKKIIYQKFPLLLLFRTAAVLATLYVVFFTPYSLEMLGIAVVCAFFPWATLIFSLPGEFLIRASEVWNRILSKGPHPSEVLKMAVEDNIGDPRPAEEVFGYKAEPFEEGVRRIVG